jgi:hypothetical protein
MARDAVLISAVLGLLLGIPPALVGVIGAANGRFMSFTIYPWIQKQDKTNTTHGLIAL